MVSPRGNGPFRGLAPFVETDGAALLGRDDEKKRVVEIFDQEDTSPVLVTGEPGTGKTSLLRAVAIPHGEAQGMLPFYVEIFDGWETQLRDELARYVGRKLDPGDDTADFLHALAETRKVKILLVLDQLEQLTWLTSPQDARLVEFVGKVDATKVQLVFGIERASLHVLGRVAGGQGRIPDARRIALSSLVREEVARLIEHTVLAGSGYLEAGLAEKIAEELCVDGPASLADVQCVCDAALRQHALTLKAYERGGGAAVLKTLYVNRLARVVGGWRVRRALALLAEAENPRALVDATEAANGAGLSEGATWQILDALVQVGLLRSVEISGKKKRYGLLHPYLRQSLRDFVAPLRDGRAGARLALRRRAGGAAIFRPHELFSIWRYLGRSLTDREAGRVRRSTRLWTIAGIIVLALPFLFYLGVYYQLATTHYLASASDAAGTPRLMLRRGDPALAFAFDWGTPAFGNVALDTGIAISSLPSTFSRKVREETISGSLRRREETISGAEGSEGKKLPRWLGDVLPALPKVRQGVFVILAGHPKEGSALLLAVAKASAKERRLATRMLLLFSGDRLVTRQALLACLGDKEESVRRYAVGATAHLSTASALPILKQAVADKDPLIRRQALGALRLRAPKEGLSLYGRCLLDADDRVQQMALQEIDAAIKRHPLQVFDIVNATLASSQKSRLSPIFDRLIHLRQRVLVDHGKVLAAHLVELLIHEKSTRHQVEFVRFLVSLADDVNAARVLPIVEKLSKSTDLTVRAEAIGLRARFGKPEEVLETLKQLAKIYRPRAKGLAMRRAAAVGLGLVRGLDKERLKVLKRLLNDPSASVRAAAVASMLRSGGPGLREIVNRMERGFINIGRAALDVVCRDLTPNRRVATVILSAAWRIKGGRLRRQALGCAQSLAAASSRLSRWLADQATVLKEATLRRAAAPAVALALQKSGRRLERLARIYLRDRDLGVRKAVLKAIAKQLPTKQRPVFLFRYIDPLTRSNDIGVRAAATALVVPTAKTPGIAVKVLVALLSDENAVVRRAAVRATQTMSRTALGTSTKDLGHALARVVSRGRGSDALAALSAAATLGLHEPLTKAAIHPEAPVRAAAVEHLQADENDKTALEVLKAARRDSEVALRLAALRAIAARSKRLGAQAVELLVNTAEASDPISCRGAFEALGHVQGKAAIAATLRYLKVVAHDRSEKRRTLAMHALGALSQHVDAAGEALFAGARDPANDVRDVALSALAAYVARTQPVEKLWALLMASAGDSVQRRITVAALAWKGRQGKADVATKLIAKEKALDPETSVSLRIAARLAIALAQGHEPPVKVLGEIYGG